MTDEQIKHMTERFLSWKLPADFNPDCGISAQRPNYGPNVVWEPMGTNLFDYTQAEAMVRHMLVGLPGEGLYDALADDDDILEENLIALADLERMDAMREAAVGMVAAWESLPGPKHYSADEVQRWISQQMKPAIDKVRKALSGDKA